MKLGFPERASAVIVIAMFAWHWTFFGVDVELMLMVPNCNDVQFMGKLTGAPRAYMTPIVVPWKTIPSPKTGRVNLVTPGRTKELISTSRLVVGSGMAL
jgi:hypothetical protein